MDAPTAAPMAAGGISNVQQDVLFILFGTSGLISVFGASFLCYLIWNSATKSSLLALSPRQRILFGLSFFDFLASCRNCITAYHDIHHQTTEPGPMCTFNGYINYIVVSAPLYNLFLSVFYYLTIRSGVSHRTFAQKYEKWGHAAVILYPFVLGTVGLPFKIYNPVGGFRPGCVSTPYPYTCTVNHDIACTRGQSALLFLFAIAAVLYAIVLPVIIVTNILIYHHVRGLETRSKRFNYTDDTAAKTRRVATQCFLYVFVFFLTWIWTVIDIIIEFIDTKGFESGKYYPLLVLEHFFYPLQGAGNLIVYLRPVYLQLRESGITRWEAFSHLFLNKPIPITTVGGNGRRHQTRANLGAISATAEDQSSQPLSGSFRMISSSPRLLSQQQHSKGDKNETKLDQHKEEEGTQELTQELTQEMTRDDTVLAEKGHEVVVGQETRQSVT